MSDLKELFVEYDKRDKKWNDLKEELEEAVRQRSAVVKQIAESVAPKKKVVRNGATLTIVVRGETYFFRGAAKR